MDPSTSSSSSSGDQQQREVEIEIPHLPLSQLVRIEVEQPQQQQQQQTRKMRLMFGDRREGQVVFLRSDGLRSRHVRAEAKRIREEKEEKERKEKEKKERMTEETMERVIEDVAGASGASGDSGAGTSSESGITSSGRSSGPSESSFGTSGASGSSSGPGTSSGASLPSTSGRMMAPNRGNRVYHPPREFHGTSTMVAHKQRWSYRMACEIDAAEQNDDGQMYYIADPFLPMPRGTRNGHTNTNTAHRMNYAAQRLENRKFRGQASRQREIIGKEQESATCDRCGMRYFLPSINMQERISYVLPVNEDEELPTVLFECPVCKITTRTD